MTRLSSLALLAWAFASTPADADTPPARVINSETYDAAGNAITSTVSGGKRGLDCNQSNALAAPANQQIIVSGAAVDPRAIRALTTADQLSCGQLGSWSILNVTGTVSLPSNAAQETGGNLVAIAASTASVDGKIRAFDVDSGGGTQNVQGVNLRLAASGGSVEAGTSANPLRTDPTGATTQPVSAASLPLPAGASSAALQTSGNASVASIDGKLTNTAGGALKTDSSAFTQPVSASTWPLPSGAATAAAQATGNASLSSVDGKLRSYDADTGAGTETLQGVNLRLSGNGGSVEAGTASAPFRTDPTGATTQPVSGTVTANAGSGTFAVSAASLPLPSGASTAANQTAGNSSLSSIDGKTPALVSGRVPVDGSGVTQPVSAAALPLPSGAATAAKQPALGTAGTASADVISVQGIASMTPLKTDGSATTQPVSGTVTANAGSGTFAVSAAALPLPAGAATSGNQTTIITSLGTIDTDIKGTQPRNISQIGGSALALGQTTAAASIPTVSPGDVSPATQSVTVQDTGSSSATGANSQTIITGTPTANSTASFALASFKAVEIQATGTWTGTLQLEVSMDGGTTWYTRGMKQAGLGVITSTFTANFEGGMNVSGMTNVRARATAAMTGTATVKVVETTNDSNTIVVNPLLLKDATTQSIVNSIKAASTAALASDTSFVVALSPNSPVPTGANTIGSVKITDGTSTAAVKAASTAAAAADTAQVVALSPNTATPLGNDRSATGNMTAACVYTSGVASACAAGSTVAINTQGASSVQFGTTGTWSGTVTQDVSYDPACATTPDAVIWFQQPTLDTDVSSGLASANANLVNWNETRNNDPWQVMVAGTFCFRLRMATFTSGTVVSQLTAGQGATIINLAQPNAATLNAQVVGNVAAGATDSGNPVKIGGVYNTTLPTLTNGQRGDLQLDSRGQLIIDAPSLGSTGAAVPGEADYIAGKDGSGNLQAIATDTSGNTNVVGNVASAAADSGNPIKIGGVYNTTLPALTNGQRGDVQMDQSGRLILTRADGYKATYSGGVAALAAVTGATDVFTITGSGTKTIRITRIGVSGTATAAASVNMSVVKRSTADTAGTSASQTAVPLDSGNAAATATLTSYTANPTLGTLVGTVRNVKVPLPTAGTATVATELLFGDNTGQALVLRGTTQQVAINFNAGAVTTANVDIFVEWTEE